MYSPLNCYGIFGLKIKLLLLLLRSEWVSHIVNKTANFLELDKINKLKVIFDTHHRITAKFILRCYQLRKESLYRI